MYMILCYAQRELLGGIVTELGSSDDLFDLPYPGDYYWNSISQAPANTPDGGPQGSYVEYRAYMSIKTLRVYNNGGRIYTNIYWNGWKGWNQVTLTPVS